MNTRHTRSTFALAALLTGALALPGLAAADGNRGWGGGQGGEARGERHYDRDGGGGRRSEWRGERRYGGGGRGWSGPRHHDRGHRYGYRDERPVYRPHRPHWLPGISVFLNGSW